jgi:hypothetical protein
MKSITSSPPCSSEAIRNPAIVSADTVHAGGAYAVGAINTSIPNLTISSNDCVITN